MTKHQGRGRGTLMRAVMAGFALVFITGVASADGLWSSALMVRPDDGYDSIFPNVEVSTDGVVWVVWSTMDPVQGDDETYCVRIENSVQSPREKIHEDNAIMDRCPLMSMGSDGVPWVVWERYSSTLGYVQVVTHWTGSGWAPAETVFTLGSRWDNYAIHASSSEDVWVVKSSRAAGRADRDLYVRHWDGSSWGEVEQVGFEGDDDTDPAMTTDGSGRAWLAWLRWNDDNVYEHKVYAARRDESGWSAPMRVENRTGNAGVCDIGTTPDGRPIVVWRWGLSQTSDLRYAVLANSGWVEGGLVNAPDDPAYDGDGSARLARSAGGDLWVTWSSGFRLRMLSYITASRWTGDGWSEEEVASVPDTSQMWYDNGPDVTVAPDGRAWAVWQRMQATSPWDTDIYVAYRDVLTAIDVWGLMAEPDGEAVRVTWQASPEIARLGFHVWRAACSGPGGGIPEEAVRLTTTAIRDCISCTFTDEAVSPGGTYCYWLDEANGGRLFGPVAASVPAADTTELGLTFSPNPFAPSTTISFGVPDPGGHVAVSIHNMAGKLVRRLVNTEMHPGRQAVTWDGGGERGESLGSGVYFCRIETVGQSEQKKLVLLR